MALLSSRPPRSGSSLEALERLLGAEASARWLPAAWILLLFVSNIRFSGFRDPGLAASGVASPENILELLVFGAIGIAAVGIVLTSRQRLRSFGPWLVGALALLALLSSLWSRVPLFSFVRGGQMVVVAALVVASIVVWADGSRSLESDWRSIWLSYLAVVSVATIGSLIAASYVGGRFTWPGHHPGTTGGLLGVGVLAISSMRLEPGWGVSPRLSRLLLPLGIAFGWVMALTISRTAIIGLLVSLLVLFAATKRYRFDVRMLALATLFILVGVVLLVLAEEVFAFIARDADLDQLKTLTGRTVLWSFALRVLAQSPIGGFGFGAGRLVLSEEIPWAGTGHNLWVETGIGLGYVGIVIATWIVLWVAYTAFDVQRRVPGPVANLAIALASFETIAAVTGSAFAIPGTSLTLTALLISALSARRLTRQPIPIRSASSSR